MLKNWKILQNPRLNPPPARKMLKRIGIVGLGFFILKGVLTVGLSLFVLKSFRAGAYTAQRAFSPAAVPQELKNLKVEEKTGEVVNLDLWFQDESGRPVQLKKYFTSQRPVLMTIVYYGCPNLCTLHLNGLADALKTLPMDFKNQFEWVVVSMNHKETSSLAALKKKNYSKHYSFPSSKMHFLVGNEQNILSLSRGVGFRFRWDKNQKIYAHLPVAYVLTPLGKISRYLYGVVFKPQTLKLSLVEASRGKIGDFVDRALLFCFQFDPRRGRYSWYAYNIMRAGGVLTILMMIIFLLPVWLRAYRKGPS